MLNNHILVSGSNHGLKNTKLVFATSPLIWILVKVHRVKPTEDGGWGKLFLWDCVLL